MQSNIYESKDSGKNVWTPENMRIIQEIEDFIEDKDELIDRKDHEKW